MDNAQASSSSKAPEGEQLEGEHRNGTGGFQANAKMAVQPPKQEDLQRSYATIVGTETNPKGWYGSMSKFFSLSTFSTCCNIFAIFLPSLFWPRLT